MSSVARDRIRRCLAMIPLIRARPGIRIPELASIFGVREDEVWEDITEVLTLCGVPPYLPHNYLVFAIRGDQVSIRFAEHLSRPVHLTLQEALAIDLALRSVSGGRPAAFGDAAPRLRRKLRDLLGGRDREALQAFDRSVAGVGPSDPVVATIVVLKKAMERNVRVRIEYYTAGRDQVSARTIEPYGLVDLRGHWYVIAGDPANHREAAFRVDRVKLASLLPDEEYEVPDSFDAGEWRREEMVRPGPRDVDARVRFSPAAAARVREEADRRHLEDAPDGAVVRVYRVDPQRPRWFYAHVARHGADAEVLSPPVLRAGMAQFLDALLEAGGAARRVTSAGAASPARAPRTAAAVSRTRQPRTKRKPRGRKPEDPAGAD
jgi:proteasome accessory factor C